MRASEALNKNAKEYFESRFKARTEKLEREALNDGDRKKVKKSRTPKWTAFQNRYTPQKQIVDILGTLDEVTFKELFGEPSAETTKKLKATKSVVQEAEELKAPQPVVQEEITPFPQEEVTANTPVSSGVPVAEQNEPEFSPLENSVKDLYSPFAKATNTHDDDAAMFQGKILLPEHAFEPGVYRELCTFTNEMGVQEGNEMLKLVYYFLSNSFPLLRESVQVETFLGARGAPTYALIPREFAETIEVNHRKALALATSERDDCITRLESHTASIDLLEQEKRRVADELTALLTRFQNGEKSLETKIKETKDAEEFLSDLLQKAKKEIEELRGKKEEHDKQLLACNKELDKMKDKLNDQQKQMLEQLQRLQTERKTITARQAALMEQNKLLLKSNQDTKTLKEELVAKHVEMEQMQKELELNAKRTNECMTKLSESANTHMNEIQNRDLRLAELERENEALQKDHAEKTRALTDKLDDCNELLKSHTHDLNEMEQMKLKLTSELDNLQKAAEAGNKTAAEEVKRVKEELAMLQQLSASTNAQVKQLEADKLRLETDLAVCHANLESKTTDHDDISEELKRIQKEFAVLLEQSTTVQSDKEKLQKYEQAMKELKQAFAELETSAREKHTEHADACKLKDDAIERLKTNLENAREERDYYTSTVMALVQQIEMLHKLCAKGFTEVQEAQSDVKDSVLKDYQQIVDETFKNTESLCKKIYDYEEFDEEVDTSNAPEVLDIYEEPLVEFFLDKKKIGALKPDIDKQFSTEGKIVKDYNLNLLRTWESKYNGSTMTMESAWTKKAIINRIIELFGQDKNSFEPFAKLQLVSHHTYPALFEKRNSKFQLKTDITSAKDIESQIKNLKLIRQNEIPLDWDAQYEQKKKKST